MLRPAPATTSSTNELVLTVSSIPIKKALSLRLLGVQFAENLSWAAHGDAIVKKVNYMLDAIRRARSIANAKAHLRMYEVFVKPRLLYCLPIWGNCGNTTANKLDKTIERALRISRRDNSAVPNKFAYTAFGVSPFSTLLAQRTFVPATSTIT